MQSVLNMDGIKKKKEKNENVSAAVPWIVALALAGSSLMDLVAFF